MVLDGPWNLSLLWPEMLLVGFGFLILLVDAFRGEDGDAGSLGYLAALGVFLAVLSLRLTPLEARPALNGMILSDGMSLFFRAALLVATLTIVLLSIDYVRRRGVPAGEFYALLLFATTGGLFMFLAADVVTFYVGLELLSIPSYVLAGLLRDDPASNEASLKYFVNGAMSSAILLFGFSLLYGATGETGLAAMAHRLTQEPDALSLAALMMVLAGLGFKVSAVPFHLWAPDAYQGAPTPVSAFLSVVSKGASFAAIARILGTALGPWQVHWGTALAVLAVVTMTVGNLTALHQTDLKRLLAYSSIAHAGYILAGLSTGSPRGFASVLFYVLAYAFTNTGAFGAVAALGARGERENLEGIRGLSQRAPVLAALMLLFLLSLIGIPPFAGFWAKLYVFLAAVEERAVWLAVAVAVNSVISVGYYYGVVKAMYVAGPAERAPVPAAFPLQLGLALAAAGVVFLGIWPDSFLRWASAVVLAP